MAREKRKSPSSFAVGLVVVVLILIGAVNVISFMADKVSEFTQNNTQYEQYEEFIAPIIMNDPDTFDDVSVANQSQLISITIWSILQDDLVTDQYEYTDSGMLMPVADVEEKFIELFGAQVTLVHTSVDGGEGVEFQYSEKQECYVIPITGITPIYTPKVIDSEESSATIVLTVAYLASEDWQQDENGDMVEPEANKYVKVTLVKTQDDGFYIRAIQSADVSEITTDS